MILTLPSSPKSDLRSVVTATGIETYFKDTFIYPLYTKPARPEVVVERYHREVTGKSLMEKYTQRDLLRSSYIFDFKGFYTEVNKTLGPKFLQRLRAHSWANYLRSWHPELHRYLFLRRTVYDGRAGGFKVLWGVDNNALKDFFEHRWILEELEKDSLLHLTPVTARLSMTPQQARQEFGKGLWKKITSWSPYRISVFGEALREYDLNKKGYPEQVVKALADAPAARINGVRLWASDDCVIWALKNAKNANLLAGTQQFYSDTEHMLIQLGRQINPNWSLKRLREEHDQAALEINRKKYSSEPFCEKDVHEVGGYTFTRLNSPLEVRTEGDMMRHCVGSYADSCAKGLYRVYTVEKGQERATLGLTKSRYGSFVGLRAAFDNNKPLSGWSFQQCYGFANKPCSEELRTAAHRLVSKINEGEKK